MVHWKEGTNTRFKMAATARPFLLLLAVFGAVFCKDKEDESCRTYAGGQVYPQEVKTGLDHALHWSKALSEYDFLGPSHMMDGMCAFLHA